MCLGLPIRKSSIFIILIALGFIMGGCQKERSNPLDPANRSSYADVFGLTTQLTNSGVELSWKFDNDLNIKGFIIYRSDGSDAVYRVIDSTDEFQRNYVDKNINEDTVFYYRLAVFDSNGKTSVMSMPVSIHITGLNEWQSLGTGLNSDGWALKVYNNRLIAAGFFTIAGDVPVQYIAAWDGQLWHDLGSGLNAYPTCLVVYDGSLIAAGGGNSNPDLILSYVMAWNGETWSPLGSGMNRFIYALTVYSGLLIAGGNFSVADGINADCIAAWRGTWQVWSSFGSSLGGGPNPTVYALGVYDGQLIAGGGFLYADQQLPVNHVAAYSDGKWTSLGSGTNGDVWNFTVYGNELYAGGDFTEAGGLTAYNIAKWNGSTWAALPAVDGEVYALTLYNGRLIAAGDFTMAGGQQANRIAQWDGDSWLPMGEGMNGPVYALAVFDGKLIALGNFTDADGKTVNHIAAWWELTE